LNNHSSAVRRLGSSGGLHHIHKINLHAHHCGACDTYPASAPTLFTGGRSDGLGARYASMISAAAFASFKHWNYGGAYALPSNAAHGVSSDAYGELLLGEWL
jgi:hypothetical protein